MVVSDSMSLGGSCSFQGVRGALKEQEEGGKKKKIINKTKNNKLLYFKGAKVIYFNSLIVINADYGPKWGPSRNMLGLLFRILFQVYHLFSALDAPSEPGTSFLRRGFTQAKKYLIIFMPELRRNVPSFSLTTLGAS